MAPKNKLYTALGAMTIGSIAASTSLLPTSFVHAETDADSIVESDHQCGGEKKCGGSKDSESSEESEEDSD